VGCGCTPPPSREDALSYARYLVGRLAARLSNDVEMNADLEFVYRIISFGLGSNDPEDRGAGSDAAWLERERSARESKT
jgi:hypothetical protein